MFKYDQDIKKYILKNFNNKKDLIELIEVLVNVPNNPPLVDALRPMGLMDYHCIFVPKQPVISRVARTLLHFLSPTRMIFYYRMGSYNRTRLKVAP